MRHRRGRVPSQLLRLMVQGRAWSVCIDRQIGRAFTSKDASDVVPSLAIGV